MTTHPVAVDLTGKVALVTGANAGIGRETARELARAGARVFLACRSEPRAREAIDDIRATVADAQLDFLALDLADLGQIREAAATWLALDLPLHLLIANAGLAGHPGQTADGFELTFGVNHIGHYLLVRLLTDRVIASAPGRIVVVSSRSHYDSRGLNWQRFTGRTRGLFGLKAYSDSKLANVIFASELARRLAGTGVDTYSLHPGVVASEIWRRIPWPIRPMALKFMITNAQGALTSLHCATAPEAAGQSGLYWSACETKRPNRLALDEALAAELWQRSARWVGLEP